MHFLVQYEPFLCEASGQALGGTTQVDLISTTLGYFLLKIKLPRVHLMDVNDIQVLY